ncbi:hypothetical protein MRX96_006099 [Rhipicephalus microplus]
MRHRPCVIQYKADADSAGTIPRCADSCCCPLGKIQTNFVDHTATSHSVIKMHVGYGFLMLVLLIVTMFMAEGEACDAAKLAMSAACSVFGREEKLPRVRLQ